MSKVYGFKDRETAEKLKRFSQNLAYRRMRGTSNRTPQRATETITVVTAIEATDTELRIKTRDVEILTAEDESDWQTVLEIGPCDEEV